MNNLTAGKIVVNSDEWTLSNGGFTQAPDTATFVTNIAKWFTAGRSTGKFYAYSTNFGLTESVLAQTMTKAGYTWTVGKDLKIDLPTLLTFDGIFLCGDAVDNQVLIDYVKAGGNVYLGAGTGVGGPQAEADRWNSFLNAFGLKFVGEYNGISGNQTINSSHPIFAGVKAIYLNNGNSIVDLDPASQSNQVILSHTDGQGLIAAFEGSPRPRLQGGKIVVNSDEWTLSNGGFTQAPDTATFVTNIAKWFTAGRSTGKFYAYSTNFGLTESVLAQTMTKAGYTWTVGKDLKIDLPTLLTFDGIFLCGDAVDNQVLIDYVKAGGNVYLGAGTGVGGPQAEADRWNSFLNAFGLKFVGEYNGISGNQTINSSHPIFAGVKAVYLSNGNSIVDLDPASQSNQVILSHTDGQGLIAAFEGSPRPRLQGGKIVVNSDEWTLSNTGFTQAPDTATFVTNIAKWFTAGRSTGKFYAYSTNFGLTESVLAQTMTKAGYTWTVGKDLKIDLPTLLTFDGIFLCGDAVDNQVLIDYVKAGGNVYLGAGTGVGGPQAEADRWNSFLNAFGLKFVGEYNGISGNQTINSSHPIFAGVKAVYLSNGNSIVDLDPASQSNQVILSHTDGQGLIAAFEGKGVASDKNVITGGNPRSKHGIADSATNFYLVDTNNPINGNGELTEWEIWAENTLPVQLIIYRKQADVWSVVGQSERQTPVIGLNQFSLSTPIKVNKGDFVGIYSPQAGSVSFFKDANSPWSLGNLSGTVLFTGSGAAPTAFSNSTNRIYSISVKGNLVSSPAQGQTTQPIKSVISEDDQTQTLWQIGKPGKCGKEFVPPGGWQQEFTYIVGSDQDTLNKSSMPFLLVKPGVTPKPQQQGKEILSTDKLNIRFTLERNYSEGELILVYDFFGSETDTLFLDGKKMMEILGVGEGKLKQNQIPLGALSQGEHTLTITTDGGNGSHWIDYLRLLFTRKSSSTPTVPPKVLSSRPVAFKVPNGQYLVAENGGGGPVLANRPHIKSWETFRLITLENGKVALQAPLKPEYLSVLPDGNFGWVGHIKEWEMLDLVLLGNNKVALKGNHGKYISIQQGGGGAVIANGPEIKAWEILELIELESKPSPEGVITSEQSTTENAQTPTVPPIVPSKESTTENAQTPTVPPTVPSKESTTENAQTPTVPPKTEKTKRKKANTIILEFGSEKKDHVSDFTQGRGRLFKKVAMIIAELQKSGEIAHGVQPVIAIIRRKKSRKTFWD